jgi:hypothetical protein
MSNFRNELKLKHFAAFNAGSGMARLAFFSDLCALGAGRFTAFGTHYHHVGRLDGSFLLDNATLLALGRGLLVALDEAHTFHNQAVFGGVDLQHPAAFAPLVAGEDQYGIIFSDVHGKSRRYQ